GSPNGRRRKRGSNKKAGAIVSRRLLWVGRKRSVQLGANFGNALGEQVVGDRALDRPRQDGRGGFDRRVGGGGTDVGQRLGFGKRDLALGGLGAAGDEVFHLGFGFGRDAFGFGLGIGDDFLGLALGAGAAGLVFAEQLGGLLLETFGVVKFGLDALGAVIERRQHRLVDAEIGKQRQQDDEGNRDPGFRLGEHPSIPST